MCGFLAAGVVFFCIGSTGRGVVLRFRLRRMDALVLAAGGQCKKQGAQEHNHMLLHVVNPFYLICGCCRAIASNRIMFWALRMDIAEKVASSSPLSRVVL